jgi:hypothetical protein
MTADKKNFEFFKSKRYPVWLLASILFATSSGFIVWALVGGNSFFEPRTIAELMNSAGYIRPVEATTQLCVKVGCVEGWKTGVGNFLRFKSSGEAEYWATVLGDFCRRDGSILVDFSGRELDVNQKKDAVDVLYSRKDWY